MKRPIRLLATLLLLTTLACTSSNKNDHELPVHNPTDDPGNDTFDWPDFDWTTPREPADEIYYHFMPVSWRDSDGDEPYRFGDFGGMIDSIPYLLTLGVTAVWINPIAPAITSHGYQGGAKDQVSDRFGTRDDFLRFVRLAHAVGIKVFIDIEMYGVGARYEWFQHAHGNPSSPYASWLAFTNPQCTEYYGWQGLQDFDGTRYDYVFWNLNDPGARDLLIGWSQFWLDPNGDGDPSDGLDGFRCDHVWVDYPYGPNGWGYNLDDFWEPWKAALQEVNPDVYVFAEQALWSSHGDELLTAFDAAFTKPFEAAAREALVQELAGPLYDAVEGTLAAVPEDRTFLCTIGNHDVSRLATAIGDDPDKGKAAAAVLLTQPFPPVIYHGDEIGMKSNSIMWWNISHREPFKWNATDRSPMSRYLRLSPNHHDNRESRDHDGRSVEEQLGKPGSLLEAYRKLIAARRTHKALRRGDYQPVAAESPNVWAFVRSHGQEQLLVVINLSWAHQSTSLDLSAYPIPEGATVPKDVLTGSELPALTVDNKGSYPVEMAAYGYTILQVEL